MKNWRGLVLILALLMSFSFQGCTKAPTDISIKKPMADYNSASPAIGYLYRRFVDLQNTEQLFTADEVEELESAQLVVKRLIIKMNKDSIAGNLGVHNFTFYISEMTEEWKIIRTILDKKKEKFPEDVLVVYASSRRDIDNTLAACNGLLKDATERSIDWSQVEDYGGILVDALGSYIDVGALTFGGF